MLFAFIMSCVSGIFGYELGDALNFDDVGRMLLAVILSSAAGVATGYDYRRVEANIEEDRKALEKLQELKSSRAREATSARKTERIP